MTYGYAMNASIKIIKDRLEIENDLYIYIY